jgi:RNA polymerase sigma-70 factor (ECF subfamily)
MTLQKKDKKRTQQVSTSNTIADIVSNETSTFQDKDLDNLYIAIKQLSDLDRAIIILYLEEKSYKEIAEVIGMNANNVGVRIQRIKQRLRKLITNTNDHE